MIVPLSIYHVVLGWADVASDFVSILSTGAIMAALPPLCGMPLRPFFLTWMIVQCALLLANLGVQTAFAVRDALRDHAGAPPAQRRRAAAWAVLRGLTNTQLAYLEFSRRITPSPRTTSAVLSYKMAELVFEAPQVVASWTVLLGRVAVDELSWATDAKPQPISEWARIAQVVSAAFGLLSLSLAVLDVTRIHPRSFWARANPPQRLFLGLIDVSPATWGRSILAAMFAFFSLSTRALVYVQIATLTAHRSFFDARYSMTGQSAEAMAAAVAAGLSPTFELPAGIPRSPLQSYGWQHVADADPFHPTGVYQAYAYRLTRSDVAAGDTPQARYGHALRRLSGAGRVWLSALLPVALAVGYAGNLLPLLAMRASFSYAAAFVSVFVNMPWVAFPMGSPGAESAAASWPSWLMAFLYLGPVLGLYFAGFADPWAFQTGFTGLEYVSPCTVEGRFMVERTCAAPGGPCVTRNTTIPLPSGGRMALWGGPTATPTGPNLAAFMALLPMFAAVELGLFLAISGRVAAKRNAAARAARKATAGGPLRPLAEAPPRELPTLLYRWSWWRPYFMSAYRVAAPPPRRPAPAPRPRGPPGGGEGGAAAAAARGEGAARAGGFGGGPAEREVYDDCDGGDGAGAGGGGGQRPGGIVVVTASGNGHGQGAAALAGAHAGAAQAQPPAPHHEAPR
ncbi:hypothetical protein Rsub_07803 [Raphidocelis subcapitata]|uniref:Uncharacterized protein n=1 Tax=Raphidocelis subcapitata TaxID=307507 RepID=A0A2V0PE59_9CHLO|nr:hypothetical protein Rsub_07803 [Raphidocelis subcapitata]|eukprot:GBF95375.1 hypothetical protein Rsub_07803 [Raphidocelis subcapitata]